MMRAMSKRTRVTVGAAASAWCVLGLAACGGAAKQADSPGKCPEGTALRGDDCVPDSAGGAKSADDDSPKGNTKGNAKPPSASSGGESGGDLGSGGGAH